MTLRGNPDPVRREREGVIPHGVMGMLLFVMAEAMLFAGLISAFQIVKAGAVVWPPLDQPRLPLEATAFNSVVLMASGVAPDRDNLHQASRYLTSSTDRIF